MKGWGGSGPERAVGDIPCTRMRVAQARGIDVGDRPLPRGQEEALCRIKKLFRTALPNPCWPAAEADGSGRKVSEQRAGASGRRSRDKTDPEGEPVRRDRAGAGHRWLRRSADGGAQWTANR